LINGKRSTSAFQMSLLKPENANCGDGESGKKLDTYATGRHGHEWSLQVI
jgi:hypothetical protein